MVCAGLVLRDVEGNYSSSQIADPFKIESNGLNQYAINYGPNVFAIGTQMAVICVREVKSRGNGFS